MIAYQRTAGTINVSVVIRITDSTDGTPETGVVFNTAGIDMWYRREGGLSVDIVEIVLPTPALDDAHADGGFLHINDGYYRLDLPDAACAINSTGVLVAGTVTGMIVEGCYIQLETINRFDAVRMGLTALPNAAADAAGGLPVSNAGGLNLDLQIGADIDAILVDTGTTLQAELDGIEAAVITNADGADIAADIIALKAETVLIVADTNELQTDNYPASIAAVKAETALIVADTDMLQTDWVGGGRLDNILDTASDPWITALPGGYAGGTAGNIVGNNLDADISGVETKIDTIDTNVDSILVDTGTTLDDALAVVDANVDQLETAIITNAAGVDIAADIIEIKAETANILADTNELQVDDTPAAIAAVKAETALIVADTNELQTDDTPAAIAAVKAETALIVADTNELQTDDIPADIAAVKAETALIFADTTDIVADTNELQTDDYPASIAAVKAETALIVADTNELQTDDTPAAIAALENISAADVNAQVLDVLNVDVFVEPGQENPAAAASLVTKISYLYKLMRNKIETTAALISVYDDAGAVVDQKATIADDGVTFARDEFVTGP